MGTNINTIAKLAGVSATTVSNFINCSETIPLSRSTRDAIMEVMRRENYRPSAASGSLRRNSVLPGKVVFIFGSYPQCLPFHTCRNPMLGDLISALFVSLRQRFNLVLEPRAVEDEDNLQAWNETIADAGAVICYGKLDGRLFELSTRRNIPLVLVSDTKDVQVREFPGELPSLDCVHWDAASHLYQALSHVVAKGARHLAFVSSWNIQRNHPVGFAVEAEAKIAEFQTFVAAGDGLSGELFYPPMPEDVDSCLEGRNVYEHLQDKELRQFDAIVCHNDFVAQGTLAALREQGLVPGRDVLVTGEGDYPECRGEVPSITTVTYDKTKLAEWGCDILERRLADNHPADTHFLVPSHLFERESTGGTGT